jgi:uncharacterized protein
MTIDNQHGSGNVTSRLHDPGLPRPSIPVTIIDADVHVAACSDSEIAEYLPEPLRSLSLGRDGSMYFAPSGGMRVDAHTKVGPPGSDPELLYKQLFEEAGVDFDLLLPLATGYFPDPEVDAAMKAATNLWLSNTWLGRYNWHGRHKGSIWIAVDNPDAAVREIEHWAGHPHFVQVLVGHHPKSLYGNPQYLPIWEAAARHGLPVAVHVDSSGYPPVSTPVGFFSHYLEHHSVGHPLVYAAHLTSLICEGVFDKFPDLHFVMVEGGFSWAGPLIWRMEKNWKAMQGRSAPMKQMPTKYFYDNIRFTTQPIEEPDDSDDLVSLFDIMDASKVLMFSSDYPHWDFDNPKRALPRMPNKLRELIFHQNAQDLYRLPATRPVDHKPPARASHDRGSSDGPANTDTDGD